MSQIRRSIRGYMTVTLVTGGLFGCGEAPPAPVNQSSGTISPAETEGPAQSKDSKENLDPWVAVSGEGGVRAEMPVEPTTTNRGVPSAAGAAHGNVHEAIHEGVTYSLAGLSYPPNVLPEDGEDSELLLKIARGALGDRPGAKEMSSATVDYGGESGIEFEFMYPAGRMATPRGIVEYEAGKGRQRLFRNGDRIVRASVLVEDNASDHSISSADPQRFFLSLSLP
jgi:hypothetical protein